MSEVTELLERMARGDAAASQRLGPLVYEELRRIAGEWMSGQREGHTLQATALVNEAWLRLVGAVDRPTFHDRRHFVRAAARAMRHVLIDHARARRAGKRGLDAAPLSLEGVVAAAKDAGTDELELSDSIARLFEVDEELGQVVELRLIAGLAMAEVAHTLEVSLATVERRWALARAWLRRELGG